MREASGGIGVTRTLIIGGGIGGMALAAALAKVGIDAEIHEQAPEIREVGAGLGMWPNALRALDEIGAGDAVRARCIPLRHAALVNHRGRVLARFDLTRLGDEEVDAAVRIVHRADLLDAICAQVAPERIHVHSRCVAVAATPTGATARLEDGSDVAAPLLAGADGVHSIVRRAVVGDDRLRYAGQTCFRGIALARLDEAELVLREIQGPGQRCAICPIDRERVYWWTAHNAAEGALVPAAERRQLLAQRFAGWPFSFAELIRATPADAILQNDLGDRAPVRGWSRGRLVLLGDAAHPTTPNLGQGANMAIDDAVVLARELAAADSVELALRRYEAARRKRTAMIVRRSRRFGRVAGWRSRPAVGLRELALRITPRKMVEAEIRRQIFEHVGPLPGRS